MSRTGDQRSPFRVAAPQAGNRSGFRLKLATLRRIGEIRWANFLERRSGPQSGEFGGGKGIYRQQSAASIIGKHYAVTQGLYWLGTV